MAIPLIQSPRLSSIEGLIHGFTTRVGGVSEGPFSSLNLSWAVGDDDGAVQENFNLLSETFGVPPEHFFHIRQIHGTNVVRIGHPDHQDSIVVQSGDVLVTDRSNILLGVSVADCFPLLLADARHQVVAAVHAGWRGTLENVLFEAITTLEQVYQSQPEELFLAIGPGIGRKHFEVASGLVELFKHRVDLQPDEFQERGEVAYLDLAAVNARLARRAGIRADRIWTSGLCTYGEKEQFFSYRRDGKITGRMLGLIGWRT